MAPDGPDDDVLFERLHESASNDPAIRQIRRRYDLLREDYERLLDRLSEIEVRLDQSSPGTTVSASLEESLTAPLRALRDEYRGAAEGLQRIISGLERLASGAFKGQHAAGESATAAGVSVETDEATGVRTVRMEVKGGDMLAFQEQLASLPGVRRAAISAIDHERATLIVELEPARPES